MIQPSNTKSKCVLITIITGAAHSGRAVQGCSYPRVHMIVWLMIDLALISGPAHYTTTLHQMMWTQWPWCANSDSEKNEDWQKCNGLFGNIKCHSLWHWIAVSRGYYPQIGHHDCMSIQDSKPPHKWHKKINDFRWYYTPVRVGFDGIKWTFSSN